MIAIKGMEEKPTNCKKCPLVGEDGNSKGPFKPMVCIPIWATTHEIKHCIGGRILEDCPLVDIVTCGECSHCDKKMVEGIESLWCMREYCATDEDYYCGSGERRE